MMQNQFQQQSPQFFSNGMPGRVVNDFAEIMASDVPMDGRVAIFPKSDYSEIHIKTWGRDGKINTVMYRPMQNEQPLGNAEQTSSSENVEEIFNELGKKIDEILSRLDKIETPKKSAKKRDGEE